RIKAAYPLSKLHAADLSLLQQRPPSPEKEGHSRIEWQNVDSAFSQCHAKEKKDPSEPYQRIEKMILCQAVTPLAEKNPTPREKQAPRKRMVNQDVNKIVKGLMTPVASNPSEQSFINV